MSVFIKCSLFGVFLVIFGDFFIKNGSTGASLVQVCCKLAPLVCNFDASLIHEKKIIGQ
jgi:hypothetical protein